MTRTVSTVGHFCVPGPSRTAHTTRIASADARQDAVYDDVCCTPTGAVYQPRSLDNQDGANTERCVLRKALRETFPTLNLFWHQHFVEISTMGFCPGVCVCDIYRPIRYPLPIFSLGKVHPLVRVSYRRAMLPIQGYLLRLPDSC